MKLGRVRIIQLEEDSADQGVADPGGLPWRMGSFQRCCGGLRGCEGCRAEVVPAWGYRWVISKVGFLSGIVISYEPMKAQNLLGSVRKQLLNEPHLCSLLCTGELNKGILLITWCSCNLQGARKVYTTPPSTLADSSCSAMGPACFVDLFRDHLGKSPAGVIQRLFDSGL